MAITIDLDPHRQQMLDAYLQKIGVTITKAVDDFLSTLSANGGIREVPDFVFERAPGGYHLVLGTALDDDWLDDEGYSEDHIDDLCSNLRESIDTGGRHRFIFAGHRWKMSKNPNVRIRPLAGSRTSRSGMEFSEQFAIELLGEIERVRRRYVDLFQPGLRPECGLMMGKFMVQQAAAPMD